MANLITVLEKVKLASGLFTTPQAGTLEYDGTVGYFTPGAGNRALLASPFIISQDADYTLVDDTTVQKLFNTSTNGAITLPSSKSYLLRAAIHVHTTGTTSHQFRIGFGGTATLTSIGYLVLHTNGSSEAGATTQMQWISAATVTTLTSAVAAASHHNIVLEGIVRINAGGTFIPQMQWTAAPGVAGVVLQNSELTLTPFGSNTATTVGPWS